MKKNYIVVISELLQRAVAVCAESEIHAVAQVKAKYDKKEIVLDAEDFSYVKFDTVSAEKEKR